MSVTKISGCRCCNSNNLIEILNFGEVPLNGFFIKRRNEKIEKFKLNLIFCKTCFHIQIGYLVNPKKLFSKYFWETGISSSNLILIDDLRKNLEKKYSLSNKSSLFEIACNDGTLLKHFKKLNVSVAGMDPAENLLNKKTKNQLNIATDFFDEKSVKKNFFNKQFDFIVARNVFAHVNNPNQLFQGTEKLSKIGSIFVIEVPHLLTIYEENQYDNIFHEHVGYHSLDSLIRMAINHNFYPVDCDIIDSQGKSLRVFFTYKKKVKKNLKIEEILSAEKKLFKKKTWDSFAKQVLSHKTKMKEIISKLKEKGKKISAYGASGKGQSLLQICGLDQNYLDFIYDKSEKKKNKYSPYGKIKIKGPSDIMKDNPDYILLLSWNIQKEILIQEKEFLRKGGKFIIPFPNPKII